MRGYITGDDSPGGHHGIGADAYAGEDNAARPEAGAGLDARLLQPPRPSAVPLRDRGQRHSRTSRKGVVCKADPGTDKDIIADLHPFPDHCLVLDRDPIADVRAGFEEDVITDVAVAPNYGPLHDVRKSPYPSAPANLLAFAERKIMNEDISCRAHCAYAAQILTGTHMLLRTMLSAAASIMRTTRQPLRPSARGFFPKRMHSKKSSTSVKSGSLV